MDYLKSKKDYGEDQTGILICLESQSLVHWQMQWLRLCFLLWKLQEPNVKEGKYLSFTTIFPMVMAGSIQERSGNTSGNMKPLKSFLKHGLVSQNLKAMHWATRCSHALWISCHNIGTSLRDIGNHGTYGTQTCDFVTFFSCITKSYSSLKIFTRNYLGHKYFHRLSFLA